MMLSKSKVGSCSYHLPYSKVPTTVFSFPSYLMNGSASGRYICAKLDCSQLRFAGQCMPKVRGRFMVLSLHHLEFDIGWKSRSQWWRTINAFYLTRELLVIISVQPVQKQTRQPYLIVPK